MKMTATALAFVMLFTVGCVPVDVQVQQDGAAISTAILSIAAQEQPINPTVAAQLVMAANGLRTATANFTTGSAVADINAAANVAEVVLQAIPQTAAFAPLVPIAIAALDLLIENAGAGATSTLNAHVAHVSGTAATGAYRAAVIPHRTLRSREGDIKAAWNTKATQIGLKQVLIP